MQTVLVPRTEKQIRRLSLGAGVATALLTFAVLGGLALACEPFESMPQDSRSARTAETTHAQRDATKRPRSTPALVP